MYAEAPTTPLAARPLQSTPSNNACTRVHSLEQQTSCWWDVIVEHETYETAVDETPLRTYYSYVIRNTHVYVIPYMRVRAGPCTPHEQLHALSVYATLPTIHLLPNRRWVSAQAAYNYFYELVIMTCNHDIAYLVRNACNANARVQSGAALGHARVPATWLLQYATPPRASWSTCTRCLWTTRFMWPIVRYVFNVVKQFTYNNICIKCLVSWCLLKLCIQKRILISYTYTFCVNSEIIDGRILKLCCLFVCRHVAVD